MQKHWQAWPASFYIGGDCSCSRLAKVEDG